MGKKRRAAPAVPGEHFNRCGVLSDAVGLRRVDLDYVAPGAKTAETDQVFDIRRREEIFAGRQRVLVVRRKLGKKREIERIARLLEPTQIEGDKRPSIAERLIATEFAVRIDGEIVSRPDDFEHGLKPAHIVLKGKAADFHLDHRIAGVEMMPHLVLKVAGGLTRPVPAAADIAENLLCRFS